MRVVLMHSSHGPVAYAFDHRQTQLAEWFADFLTSEIDPAQIVAAADVPDGTPWRNPFRELLTWRDSVRTTPACRHNPDRQRLARIREVHADLVAEHRDGCGVRREGLAHAIEALAEAWHGHEPADPYAPLDPDQPG